MKQDEFINYLRLACKNLQFTKALEFNLEMELKRLLKTKNHEEVEQILLGSKKRTDLS